MTAAEQTKQPNGAYGYTVTSPEQVESLPYYYLVALSDQTQFVNPIAAVAHWYCGPFTVLGLLKGR